MQIDFNTIIDDQKKLKDLGAALKKSIDDVQARFDGNMVEIIKVMDQNQKKHASAMSDIYKTIESILSR